MNAEEKDSITAYDGDGDKNFEVCHEFLNKASLQ